MTKNIVLYVKGSKNAKFHEELKADLFNDDQMVELIDSMMIAVNLGYEVKVELKEEEALKNE